jgi:hypothetical protein
MSRSRFEDIMLLLEDGHEAGLSTEEAGQLEVYREEIRRVRERLIEDARQVAAEILYGGFSN